MLRAGSPTPATVGRRINLYEYRCQLTAFFTSAPILCLFGGGQPLQREGGRPHGAFTGDEEKKAEGRAQQRKGEAGKEAAKKAKRRQTEKEAKEAEKERDRQRRKDKGGLLGNVGDTLSGR